MAVSVIALSAAAVTAMIFVAPLPGVDRASLYYLPYPQLTLPPLSLALGAATWGLLMPAAVLAWQIMLAGAPGKSTVEPRP